MAENDVNVLLSEYEACHSNRNHYDSIRWTIGSIFIATSLTLFAISFWKEILDELPKVLLVAIFSVALMGIWYIYNQFVNSKVMASIFRFHEIEIELRRRGHGTRLHRSIAEVTASQIRGIWVTYMFFMVVLGAWVFRLIFWYWSRECALSMYLVLMVIIAFILYLVHAKIFNRTNWGERIRNLLEEEERERRNLPADA